MTRAILLATLWIYAAASSAADVIPPHLVGIWATDAAVFRGTLLLEGEGLYLGADGIGVVIGGPPPIGYRIVATYSAPANTIFFEATEQGKTVGTGSMVYDPALNIIKVDKDKGPALRRRFDEFTDATREALGLEATAQ
jgi:hypothetical protein